MFTGIIEEVGTVEFVRELGGGREIRIGARAVLEGVALGDSISIDGACHTVAEAGDGWFTVHSVATTLARTTVGEFGAGRRVNLERAMALGARLGGHLVQGHVDGTGRVRSIQRRGEHVLIDFSLPVEVAGVTILHGSIALNGISLTVNALPENDVAQVSIIPFTWDHTALPDLAVGDTVNLEGDLIGKYVRRMLGAPSGAAGDVDADLMRKWGYTA